MVAWPAQLPQDQFIGLTDTRQDARIRSPMETGPAKVRRRFTAAVRLVSIPIKLTGAQREQFDIFYIVTLAEGSVPFTWEDPVTDAVKTFRFTSEVPSFTLEVGGPASDRVWSGMLNLEILP